MKAKDITLVALMVALLAICSQLSIPIQPVPITLQTLAVLMIGFLLTPRNAFLAGAIYMILGLIGLPVFAGFSGGYQSFISPAFGFIISFMFAAGLGAWYLKGKTGLTHYIVAGLIMTAVTYLIGIPYMGMVLNGFNGASMSFYQILMAGLIPFIPGDLIKFALAVVLAKQLRPRLVDHRI